MENGQNLADEIKQIDEAVKSTLPVTLSAQQQLWIDYNALSGLITDVTGTGGFDREGNELRIRKMPITEFSQLIGVSRETLRAWRLSIPDFWKRVEDRRQELAPQSRVQAFHEKWYMAALSMKNWQVSEAWAINFLPNYKAPKLKVEHDLGNSWAALLGNKRKIVENIVEGEVVDATPDANQS
jgi:hypothetical protein